MLHYVCGNRFDMKSFSFHFNIGIIPQTNTVIEKNIYVYIHSVYIESTHYFYSFPYASNPLFRFDLVGVNF